MKQLVLILVFITFIGLLIGANIYMPRRFAANFGLESARWLYIAFTVMTLFMIVGVMAFTNSVSLTGHILYSIAAFTMGFMLYLALSTLFIDLLNLALKLKPVVNGLVTIGLALAISLFGTWNSFNLKVTNLEIPVENLKEEIRVMHLSDIHLGHFRGKSFLQRIVDKTNMQNPDIVFLTGDLFDGKIRLKEENLKPLLQLKAPIFFVEGNHDGYTGVDTIKHFLRKINVSVMEDEVIQWQGIQLIGLNHMAADRDAYDMHAANGKATIKEVLASLTIDPGQPSILLHHSPDGVQYAAEKGIDLYLSGHTHAGQLFPINYLNDIIFAYNKGLHEFNGTRIFVSQGTGTFGPPMRVGTHAELCVLNLVPAHR